MGEIMRKTPLSEVHVELGARMVPFAGWEMPVQYSEGILAEHHHTREQVSLFDICHMGEFRVKGGGTAAALDHILARSVMDQKVGTCRYNFLLTPDGTVIDDLVAYRIDENEFYIVVNAGTRDGDAAQIRDNLPVGIEFTDESDQTAKLDLQGPKSVEILAKFGFAPEQLPTYFRWIKTEIAGIPCILSRTGYTGELGFEFYFAAEKAVELWNKLIECDPVKPAGLGARDTLRLEMGYALYGHELNLETTPLDAGYGPMLKLDQDRNFIGSEALRGATVKKHLTAIELEGRRAAREGAEVFINGEEAGKVSSGAFAPSLGKAVAMAYVAGSEPLAEGTALQLSAGRGRIPGVVTSLPFYKSGSVRNKI